MEKRENMFWKEKVIPLAVASYFAFIGAGNMNGISRDEDSYNVPSPQEIREMDSVDLERTRLELYKRS
jgi:hypothetical protein